LKWPRGYPSSAEDRQKDAQSLTALMAAGCIGRQTVLKAIASSYDIEFIEDETDQTMNDADLPDANG
jgi:hypothetical protein